MAFSLIHISEINDVLMDKEEKGGIFSGCFIWILNFECFLADAFANTLMGDTAERFGRREAEKLGFLGA